MRLPGWGPSPLSKERAYELMARDLTVYIVQQGENPAMAFDTTDDLDAHDGIFAVTREEWEESPALMPRSRSAGPPAGTGAGVPLQGDCFAIYQVNTPTTAGTSAMRGWNGSSPSDARCSGQLRSGLHRAAGPGDLKGSVLTISNTASTMNTRRLPPPASMSVSDIVAIKADGKVSCHYCDSFGFPRFPASCRTTR